MLCSDGWRVHLPRRSLGGNDDGAGRTLGLKCAESRARVPWSARVWIGRSLAYVSNLPTVYMAFGSVMQLLLVGGNTTSWI